MPNPAKPNRRLRRVAAAAALPVFRSGFGVLVAAMAIGSIAASEFPTETSADTENNEPPAITTLEHAARVGSCDDESNASETRAVVVAKRCCDCPEGIAGWGRGNDQCSPVYPPPADPSPHRFASRSIIPKPYPIPVGGIAEPGTIINPSMDRPGLRSGDPLTLDHFTAPLYRQDLMVLGSQSCGQAGCHGGPRPGVTQPRVHRGSEYKLWIENDPHARSWRTFCSDESVAMMRRLKILDGDGHIIDPSGYDNCLACHNTTRRHDDPRVAPEITRPEDVFADTTGAESNPGNCVSGENSACRTHEGDRDPTTNRFHREGVGCAGCHGPSGQWIGTHYQWGFDPYQSTDSGFVAAGDLFVRGRMCAACHVGDRDRDMNHNIIAAGHPPLRYELATFHNWQPKHWRDAEAVDRFRFEPQLWLAGQIAQADAALSVLESRAQKRLPESTWPELSMYDCGACHQNLRIDPRGNHNRDALWADEVDSGSDREAVAVYSRFNDAGLRWVIDDAASVTGLGDPELAEALRRVRDHMQSSAIPDAAEAASLASDARQKLFRWYQSNTNERRNFDAANLLMVTAKVAGKKGSLRTWESAAQFYLAAVASRSAWPGGIDGPTRAPADQIRDGLRHDETIDMDRYYDSAQDGRGLDDDSMRRLALRLAGTFGPVEVDPAVLRSLDEPSRSRVKRDLDQMRAVMDDVRGMIEEVRTEAVKRLREEQPPTPTDREPEDSSLDMKDGKNQTPPKPEPRRVPSEEELLEMLRDQFRVPAKP